MSERAMNIDTADHDIVERGGSVVISSVIHSPRALEIQEKVDSQRADIQSKFGVKDTEADGEAGRFSFTVEGPTVEAAIERKIGFYRLIYSEILSIPPDPDGDTEDELYIDEENAIDTGDFEAPGNLNSGKPVNSSSPHSLTTVVQPKAPQSRAARTRTLHPMPVVNVCTTEGVAQDVRDKAAGE